MASTRAASVKRFSEKPNTYRKKKVPINDTGTAISGMSVERVSCKKIYTTMNTSTNASKRVLMRSSIEAKRNSVTSCMMSKWMPGGIEASCSFSSFLMFVAISVALEPAVCVTIMVTDGLPLFFDSTVYERAPISTRATSFTRIVCPSCVDFMIMSPNSSGVFRRPL